MKLKAFQTFSSNAFYCLYQPQLSHGLSLPICFLVFFALNKIIYKMICLKHIKYVENGMVCEIIKLYFCVQIERMNSCKQVDRKLRFIFEILLSGLTGETDSIGTYTASTTRCVTCITFKIAEEEIKLSHVSWTSLYFNIDSVNLLIAAKCFCQWSHQVDFMLFNANDCCQCNKNKNQNHS